MAEMRLTPLLNTFSGLCSHFTDNDRTEWCLSTYA